jgi:hypothetical protein
MTDITNKNMLSPVGFQFNIQRMPTMNFFVQSVTLPGITVTTLDQQTPLRAVPTPGDRIEYSELEVIFKVDEDMKNYIEVFEWARALGFPDSTDQYKELEEQPSFTGGGIYSDATLTVLSSAMNPNIRIEITDLFPVSLSPIEMSAINADIEYIEATASFRFLNYSFNKL